MYDFVILVSEDDVNREAQELELPREMYVNDLQLGLTGEGQASQNFTFHLEPNGPMLQLSYEKEQCDMSVSKVLLLHWILSYFLAEYIKYDQEYVNTSHDFI